MIINSEDIEYNNFYNDFIQQKEPILNKNAFYSNTLYQIVSEKIGHKTFILSWCSSFSLYLF